MAQPSTPPPIPGPAPPVGPTPYPPPYPPPYYPPPYYPPPAPKSTNIVIIVVIVILILVLVPIILAAVLYVFVSGLTGPPPSRPIVSFGQSTLGINSVTLPVAAVSQSVSPTSFQANLFVNSTVGTAQPVSPSFTITVVGEGTFSVTFRDVGVIGRLDAGDEFRLTANAGWRAGASYQFELLWTDGSPVGFVTWRT